MLPVSRPTVTSPATAQPFEQRGDAGQHSAAVSVQAGGQVAKVGRQETLPVVRRLRDGAVLKQVAADGPIGSAAERNAVGRVGGTEGGGQGRAHRGPAGAAAGQKGAVDVEQADDHDAPRRRLLLNCPRAAAARRSCRCRCQWPGGDCPGRRRCCPRGRAVAIREASCRWPRPTRRPGHRTRTRPAACRRRRTAPASAPGCGP